jgi:HCOMODA/2-hydroxy-3-carboxy-muconic semialdehyde decarboxylase
VEPAEIVAAARVLARFGLVTAFGHVSARVGRVMLITPATDLAQVSEADLVEVADDAASLPPGAPAESFLHLALYQARPEVTAIARAQPAAALAVTAATTRLEPAHGQACWLGRSVPVHDDARLIRTADLGRAAAATLPEGEALLLRGNGAVTVGTSPGLAATRMWLLAAACELWLTLPPDAERRLLSAAEIDSWREVADELLPRLWRHLSHSCEGRTA